MRVRPFTMSLLLIGPGAAEAMTASASLVISDAFSTAWTALRSSSLPSADANQRRTLRTSSSWVSPSKFRVGMRKSLRRDQRQQLEQDARRRAPHRLVGDLEEVHRPIAQAREVPSLLVVHVGVKKFGDGDVEHARHFTG